MVYQDLVEFFKRQKFQRVIIAADAQPRVSVFEKDKIITKIPAGGVAIALDPIARASNALYIGRGKTEADEQVLDRDNKLKIEDPLGNYILKRLFLTDPDMESYYYGFSNQTLWPLCHVAFEPPEFKDEWYEGFKKVNSVFAGNIKREIKGKTFIWLNDYQLCLVPKFLGHQKDAILAMFWHIPWPTWEVFRILPYKQEILESMLMCDFIAFHRGYQARNFLETVRRELEVRIDDETNKVYYNSHVTTVKNLPLGIDSDVIESLVEQKEEEPFIARAIRNILGQNGEKKKNNNTNKFDEFFKAHRVILGVDRLDYTKGLLLRLSALDYFFEKNPQYLGNVIYLGVIAPSREPIPSYRKLKKDVKEMALRINEKYATRTWKPVYLAYDVFGRKEILNLYERADVCLVTPRDDGMNLVSKEFVLASSFSKNPGMLVLSMFAGSAIDLIESLIVNPYDIDEVASAIKKALTMSREEKVRRIRAMAETLKERNIYEWAEDFVRSAISAAK